MLVLKNNTSEQLSYLSNSIVIAAYGQFTVPNNTTYLCAQDIQVRQDALIDKLIIYDGITEYAREHAVLFLEKVESPKDADGSPLSRTKVTTYGWHYQLHGIEFETSKLNCIVSKKVDNSNYGFSVAKFYKNIDGQEIEITGQDLTQEYLDTNCIKTIIDWEPTHDLEIIGGCLRQKAIPTEDLCFWVVGVPDVPENYGGSKPFVVNVNLAYVGLVDGVKVDGRAPKYLTYNSQNHTNKIRLIFRHSAGFKHKMHMIIELFKE